MANEMAVSVGGTFTNSNGSDSISATPLSLTTSDVAVQRGCVASTTPVVAVVWPALTGRSCAIIKNTGDTNALLVSFNNSTLFDQSIPAGGILAIYPSDSEANIYVKSAASTTTYDTLAG